VGFLYPKTGGSTFSTQVFHHFWWVEKHKPLLLMSQIKMSVVSAKVWRLRHDKKFYK
jgi:hypothetical protein